MRSSPLLLGGLGGSTYSHPTVRDRSFIAGQTTACRAGGILRVGGEQPALRRGPSRSDPRPSACLGHTLVGPTRRALRRRWRGSSGATAPCPPGHRFPVARLVSDRLRSPLRVILNDVSSANWRRSLIPRIYPKGLARVMLADGTPLWPPQSPCLHPSALTMNRDETVRWPARWAFSSQVPFRS
jgi:hypothetical protein